MARLADGATPQFMLGRDYSVAGVFLGAGLPSYRMLGRDYSAAGVFLGAGLPSYSRLGRDCSAAGVFLGAGLPSYRRLGRDYSAAVVFLGAGLPSYRSTFPTRRRVLIGPMLLDTAFDPISASIANKQSTARPRRSCVPRAATT
jgi:hypothetical protein